MKWSQEQVERLRALIAVRPEMTAAAMGAELGVTRNTIIGRMKRLGTPPRTRKGNPWKRNERRRAAYALSAKPHPRPTLVRREPPQSEGPTNPVSIADLTDHTCRWPLGEPSATMLYCGAYPIPYSPYCQNHTRMAFTPRDAARPRSIKYGH